MLKSRGVVATLGVLGLLASGAVAAGEPGVYAGVTAIGSYGEMRRLGFGGFASPEVENDTDLVGGGGARIGYAWREIPLRTEIEAAHRYRFDLDLRDARPAGIVDYETNVGTTTVLLNAIVEFRNAGAVTPFFGASLGWARHRVETDRTVLATGARSSRDRSSDDLAWGLMLGADWSFAERWTAEASYRFIHLGEVDAGGFGSGESYRADDYTSHELLLGLRYRLY